MDMEKKDTGKPKPKPLRVQDVMIYRAAAVSDENPEVREELIMRVWNGFTKEQRTAADKLIMMMCGTSFDRMATEAGENCVEMDERTGANTKGMTVEQLKDYREFADFVPLFASEMLDRFARKIKEGRRGFNGEEIVRPVHEEIAKRLHRMESGESDIGVGIANWAFISWYREHCMS